MNAPTPASAGQATANAAAPATSHAANSTVAHPARREDNGRSFIARLASSSIDRLDGLIAELNEMREVLLSEGERVQREVGHYARLAQTAVAATKATTESVALARSNDVAGLAQNSSSRQLSGGREKLKRWPPPAS